MTLLESVNFIALGLGETVLVLGDLPEQLTFVLNFTHHDFKKEPSFSANQRNSKTLVLNFENWDHQLGIGLKDSLELGTFKGRKLFLAIVIRKMGPNTEHRLITASFYLGEVVANG